MSKYFKVNLDIGHFTAGNFDAVAYMKEHHLGTVDDEAAGRHRLHPVRIVLGPSIHPPRAGEDGDVAIVGMKVRAAVVMRKPFLEHHVEAGLGRITDQDRLPGTRGILLPLDLVRQDIGDGGGI